MNKTPANIEPAIYQIKIKGYLDDQWADWFDGLTITHQGEAETLLVGHVKDQGALHGMLAKIRDLGLHLISVETFQRRKNHEKICRLLPPDTPSIFGFILIVLFSLLSTLTWPITQIYREPEGYEVGETLAKLLIAACFILLLWRFDWLKNAGFHIFWAEKHLACWPLDLQFTNALERLCLYGRFRISVFPAAGLTIAILFFTFATSLLEETMYRGLLLTAMVKAWGSTRKGLFAAAILSGFFWASLHFFNLLVRPFPLVALQVL